MKKAFKIIKFFLSLREEMIHTQCLVRELKDLMENSSQAPSIMEKKYLSVSEAAKYIDSTENFIKNLVKNHDIDSYISPYKGYMWVRREDLDHMIERNRIMSPENIRIASLLRSRNR